MNVDYYHEDNLVYSTKTNDLAGLIAAIEKSESLHFQHDIYKLESFLLNHYLENGKWCEKFIVYITK
ncbi:MULTISPECIES: hypothetical protein [unclassified Bacillus (in: firmicutes)]|uniref:hypothetical protein n=1 Tax=unclassified Bacillus (in: firmicutes) TaxID=185979 RepID=UPI001BE6B5CC|nr:MULTISPECIES: hypothetical protein [unclassified Bacillus (in: firmicutes)]MBT2615314.1 hypothetical protein [Bacillus sp. ISL-78]MBT2628072.1 hypothetical protein [Bacillus sp. ISL-101]